MSRIARGYEELGRTEWPIAVGQAVAEHAKHVHHVRVWLLLTRERVKRARGRHA